MAIEQKSSQEAPSKENKAEKEEPRKEAVKEVVKEKAPAASEKAVPAPAKEPVSKDVSGTAQGKLSKKLQDLLGEIGKMTVLELADFVKALEQKFGVTAAAPVAVAGAPAAQGPAEEKDSFTVVLTKVGDKKIQVIKEIRSVTTLGLKEAKDLVDSCPKPVKDGIPKKEAEELKKKLEAVGAAVELK